MSHQTHISTETKYFGEMADRILVDIDQISGLRILTENDNYRMHAYGQI